MLYKTYIALMLYAERKIWTVNMLVNWLYFSGIRTLLFLWWATRVEPVLKRTCIERPPNILWISSLYTQSAYVDFCGLCCLKKDVISYPKNITAVKKGVAKKVQVTKRLKSVKSLCGQEEKIYQQGYVELQHTKQVNFLNT